MAYLEKYVINFCDDFNVTRKVSVLQRDYAGASTELMADVNPISIVYDSSEDFKFSPIRPSVAEVNMIFNTESGVDFEEFWIADEKEFKVESYINATVDWVGYVIPNGFSYDLKGGLYHANLQAADGLSTLEAYPFRDEINNKPYGNQDLTYNNEFEFPFILIFTEILRKLELDLDIWTCVDSYESTMTKTGDTRYADPLATSFVNVKTYVNQNDNRNIAYWSRAGEEWNCKEVIENCLCIFGAKVYQENGAWRIKSVNADADYGTGSGQRYWRKYNSLAVYIPGYETIDNTLNIPCGDGDKFLIEDSHTVSMDDVYKAYRMNYEYSFLSFGDTPTNLLKNGDFCEFNNNSKLAAPEGWERWRRDNKWHIRIKDITIPFSDAGGNVCGLEIGTHHPGMDWRQTDPNAAIWTSLRNEVTYSNPNRPRGNNSDSTITKGDTIIFDIWNKYRPTSPDGTVIYSPMYRLILQGDNGNDYYLRNNSNGYTWEKINALNSDLEQAYFFSFARRKAVNIADNIDPKIYAWYHFNFDLEPVPEGGNLQFHIHGLAASTGRDSSNFPAFTSWVLSGDSYVLRKYWKVVRQDWVDQGGDIPRLQVTGVSLGVIPEESELPQLQDYTYENTNPNYTLEPEPKTIYNGDVQDEKHISNIIVPSNSSGDKNFWDTIDNQFGSSSLGLLTVREVMRQYSKPYRRLEGSAKVQSPKFGAVYTFEAIPNVRFVLQRGSFNVQKQFIEDASFIQISDSELEDGGYEGGNTLDPEWTSTGKTYCQTSLGLNTGYVIVEEIDINPNSETFKETREVVSDNQNLTTCPLGQPRKYYWGSDDVHLNIYTLEFSPFIQIDSKTIQVSFKNTDGNYIYFLHLEDLGLVERIYTITTPGNVIGDWVYLGDQIIDGYTYRVLRTDYVMSEFNNFTHNFKFN